MSRTFLIAWASAFVLASSPAAHAAQSLFGITLPTAGNSTFVQVNPLTGQATSLFTFPVPSTPLALAYDAPANRFIALSCSISPTGPDSPQFVIIDPAKQSSSTVAIAGLPAGQQGVQGAEYDPALGTLLITFGNTDTSVQRRIAAVGLDGVVTQVSSLLNLPDADELAFDPNANGLRIFDSNDDGIVAIDNVFGSPTLTPLVPNPNDGNLNDGAYFDSGQFFVPRFSSRDLYSLSGNSFEQIGSFGTSTDVSGLAFESVPEPSSLALMGAGGLLMLRRRRQKHNFDAI